MKERVCHNVLVLLDRLDVCVATQTTGKTCNYLCHHSPLAMCQMDARTFSSSTLMALYYVAQLIALH